MPADTTPRPSTVKVLDQFTAQLQRTDQEIAEGLPDWLPVTPTMFRGLLATLSSQIPDDPAELDRILLAVASFCIDHVSDGPPTYAIVQLDADDQVVNLDADAVQEIEEATDNAA